MIPCDHFGIGDAIQKSEHGLIQIPICPIMPHLGTEIKRIVNCAKHVDVLSCIHRFGNYQGVQNCGFVCSIRAGCKFIIICYVVLEGIFLLNWQQWIVLLCCLSHLD